MIINEAFHPTVISSTGMRRGKAEIPSCIFLKFMKWNDLHVCSVRAWLSRVSYYKLRIASTLVPAGSEICEYRQYLHSILNGCTCKTTSKTRPHAKLDKPPFVWRQWPNGQACKPLQGCIGNCVIFSRKKRFTMVWLFFLHVGFQQRSHFLDQTAIYISRSIKLVISEASWKNFVLTVKFKSSSRSPAFCYYKTEKLQNVCYFEVTTWNW